MMNRVLGDSRPEYMCKKCRQELFVSGNYLPRHRAKKGTGKERRALCKGSEEHVSRHKRVVT